MLILTRSVGETIRINEDISIVVVSVKGPQIRLGVDAPEDIPVYRQEIYQRIKAEKEQPQNS